MIAWYWGRPLTTRIAGAPLFYGLRIGRWLLGRLGRAAAVPRRDVKPANVPLSPRVAPRDNPALEALLQSFRDGGWKE